MSIKAIKNVYLLGFAKMYKMYFFIFHVQAPFLLKKLKTYNMNKNINSFDMKISDSYLLTQYPVKDDSIIPGSEAVNANDPENNHVKSTVPSFLQILETTLHYQGPSTGLLFQQR